LEPENQIIFQGQNAFFNCLLNGTNGKLIPVQWNVQMIDSPTEDITTNSTQYMLLPPANSILVIVRPFQTLFITCRGGTRSFFADLIVQGKLNLLFCNLIK